MSDNKKQEKDYTKEVDAILPEAEAVVKVCLHLSIIIGIDLAHSLESCRMDSIKF